MQDNDYDIMAQLMRVGELLHRFNHRNHRMHGPAGDPNRGQGRVMALLKMRPEISQKELSYLLDIRPQSLGELLAKLERAGYVERAPSETDRRVMDIRLTEEGSRAAEKNPERENPIKSLDAEQQKVLADYLDKVIADLEEELKDFQPEHEGCRGGRHPHHERRWHPDMDGPAPHGRCHGRGHDHGPEFGHDRGHGHGCQGRGRMRGEMPRFTEE